MMTLGEPPNGLRRRAVSIGRSVLAERAVCVFSPTLDGAADEARAQVGVAAGSELTRGATETDDWKRIQSRHFRAGALWVSDLTVVVLPPAPNLAAPGGPARAVMTAHT